jgi:hypothetical protein
MEAIGVYPAQGNTRKKTSELRGALRGRITAHHRPLLELHLDVIDALLHTFAKLDAAPGKSLAPIRQCRLAHAKARRRIRRPRSR